LERGAEGFSLLRYYSARLGPERPSKVGSHRPGFSANRLQGEWNAQHDAAACYSPLAHHDSKPQPHTQAGKSEPQWHVAAALMPAGIQVPPGANNRTYEAVGPAPGKLRRTAAGATVTLIPRRPPVSVRPGACSLRPGDSEPEPLPGILTHNWCPA
jgi:hypothetical protein